MAHYHPCIICDPRGTEPLTLPRWAGVMRCMSLIDQTPQTTRSTPIQSISSQSKEKGIIEKYLVTRPHAPISTSHPHISPSSGPPLNQGVQYQMHPLSSTLHTNTPPKNSLPPPSLPKHRLIHHFPPPSPPGPTLPSLPRPSPIPHTQTTRPRTHLPIPHPRFSLPSPSIKSPTTRNRISTNPAS